MTNLADKQLLSKVFVGGIGLILLGIGIAGLTSLRPTLVSVTFTPTDRMMGSDMMRMMDIMNMDMMRGFAGPVGPFGTEVITVLNAYLYAMLGIYIGLIVIGGYLIYRTVAPLMKVSIPGTTA